MKKIVVIIFGAFITTALADAIPNILNSFSETFQKLHRQLGLMETMTHGSANEITRHYALTLKRYYKILRMNQDSWRNYVAEAMKDVLKKLNFNLASRDKNIKKCVVSSANELHDIIQKSEGGLHVCRLHDAQQLQQIKNILKQHFLKQQQERNDLEEVRKYCNSISRDSKRLKECFYNQLIIIHPNVLQVLKQDSEKVLHQYFNVYNNLGQRIMKCANSVIMNIVDEIEKIPHKFKYCCIATMDKTFRLT